MTIYQGLITSLLFPLVLVVGCGTVIETPEATVPSASEPPRLIEIAIKDYAYVMVKPEAIRSGTPAVITLRNEDQVTHGFVSPMLIGPLLQAEAEGITAWGKGVEGFHLDPGKTLTIRFTPEQLGVMSFHCDIHRQMKEGELLYLDIRPSRPRLK
jgi:plastocyanin